MQNMLKEGVWKKKQDKEKVKQKKKKLLHILNAFMETIKYLKVIGSLKKLETG